MALDGAAAGRGRWSAVRGVPGVGNVRRTSPSRPWGTQPDSPSLVRLARAPFAFGRLFSNSISMASW